MLRYLIKCGVRCRHDIVLNFLYKRLDFPTILHVIADIFNLSSPSHIDVCIQQINTSMQTV